MRDCVARRARNEPQRILCREIVHLVHDAIDIERQCGSFAGDLVVISEHAVYPAYNPPLTRYREADLGKTVE